MSLSDVPRQVKLREVGPREGFQRGEVVDAETKAEVIDALARAGMRTIQHVSFVNPKYTPQWANALETLKAMKPEPDVVYDALVLNRRGLADAAKARDEGLPVNQISLLGGATAHVLNANGIPYDVKEDMEVRLLPLTREALELGFTVIPGVSAAYGCADSGAVEAQVVIDLVREIAAAGATRVYLSDSTGEATPAQVVERVRSVRDATDVPLNVHLHDNRGQGVACILALLLEGFDDLEYDTAVGGVGGCQFIEAAGNVASDDVLFMLEGLGVETGVSLPEVIAVSERLQQLYDYPLASHVSHYGTPKWLEEQWSAVA